jgi:hypothetical protein
MNNQLYNAGRGDFSVSKKLFFDFGFRISGFGFFLDQSAFRNPKSAIEMVFIASGPVSGVHRLV